MKSKDRAKAAYLYSTLGAEQPATSYFMCICSPWRQSSKHWIEGNSEEIMSQLLDEIKGLKISRSEHKKTHLGLTFPPKGLLNELKRNRIFNL